MKAKIKSKLREKGKRLKDKKEKDYPCSGAPPTLQDLESYFLPRVLGKITFTISLSS